MSNNRVWTQEKRDTEINKVDSCKWLICMFMCHIITMFMHDLCLIL